MSMSSSEILRDNVFLAFSFGLSGLLLSLGEAFLCASREILRDAQDDK